MARLEDLSQSLRFIPEPAGSLGLALLNRVMGENIVSRANVRLRCRHPQSGLGKNVAQPDHLRVGRLAALIGAGQDGDAMMAVYADIVPDDVALPSRLPGTLQCQVQGCMPRGNFPTRSSIGRMRGRQNGRPALLNRFMSRRAAR